MKADLEEVVSKSRELDIPIGLLGVEGWQQVPDGPRFFARLRSQAYRPVSEGRGLPLAPLRLEL